MDLLQLITERHSVRAYSPQPVTHEVLQTILEAGRLAPTAANKQPQRFLLVSSADGLTKLRKAANIHDAPQAIVICSLKDAAWERPQDGHSMAEIDATIATTHMMLQAWSKGIASCWITWFDPAVVCREFALPDNAIPVNILVLGYAKEQAHGNHPNRMPLADMVWEESIPCSFT